MVHANGNDDALLPPGRGCCSMDIQYSIVIVVQLKTNNYSTIARSRRKFIFFRYIRVCHILNFSSSS